MVAIKIKGKRKKSSSKKLKHKKAKRKKRKNWTKQEIKRILTKVKRIKKSGSRDLCKYYKDLGIHAAHIFYWKKRFPEFWIEDNKK